MFRTESSSRFSRHLSPIKFFSYSFLTVNKVVLGFVRSLVNSPGRFIEVILVSTLKNLRFVMAASVVGTTFSSIFFLRSSGIHWIRRLEEMLKSVFLVKVVGREGAGAVFCLVLAVTFE